MKITVGLELINGKTTITMHMRVKNDLLYVHLAGVRVWGGGDAAQFRPPSETETHAKLLHILENAFNTIIANYSKQCEKDRFQLEFGDHLPALRDLQSEDDKRTTEEDWYQIKQALTSACETSIGARKR